MAVAIHSTPPVQLTVSPEPKLDVIDSLQQVISFSGVLDIPKAQLYSNLPRGIHSDIEDIIRAYPTRIAVEQGTEGVKLTYEALNNLACQVAAQLIQAGIEPEELVPVVASRTPYAIAAILGVLKAGGAYVPCDAEEWTRERLDTVLSVVKPKNVVVSDPAFVALLASYSSVKIIETPKVTAPVTAVHSSRPLSNNLAYVIMTSGSTGTPKGVMVEHRNLMQYIRRFESDRPANLNVHLGDRVFLVYSIAFDAFSGVMWSTICNGGTLCLADKTNIASVAKTVTILPATPSLLSSLVASEFPNIRSVFSGGEALSLSLVKSWATADRRFFNCYGPTETTCVSTMTEVTAETTKVTIGRPLAGYAALILDADLKPVGVGESGEIVVGGAGVGRGYLGDTRKTEQSFVNIEWVDQQCGGHSTGKWYRTGDYAKWTPDGNLEYLGRADWRIKNRGFLIDLEGDVEHNMVTDEAVSDARAFKIHGRLIGVVTPGSIDTKALRERILQRTPAYMVCDQIWALDDFPRSSNDKIDRKALQCTVELLMEDEFAASGPTPSTPAEVVIADGFQMLFDMNGTIGVDTAFIEMGGHSLMAIRLVSFAKAAGLSITFQDVMRCNTIKAIAEAARLISASDDDVQEKATISEEDRELLSSVLGPDFEAVAEDISPLTPSQRGMFMETMSKQSVYVLQTRALLHDKIGSFDIDRFYSAWEHIVQRHSIFRSSFHLDRSVQIVHKQASPISRNIQFFTTESQVTDAIETYTKDDFDAGFTLEDLSFPGRMMRLALFAIPESGWASFVWTIHHGLIDGVSATILQEELISLYENGVLPSHSAVVPRSFLSVAREIVSDQATQDEAATTFWRQHLEGASTAPPLNLPSITSSVGSEIVFDSDLQIDEVAAFAQKCGVTITTVFLAAAAIVLSQYTDKAAIVLGVVYTGRSATAHADQVVGPVVNTLPVFVNMEDRELAVKDLLRSLSKDVLSVASWEWSSLGSVMAAARIFSNTSLFDFAFSFADDFASVPISQAATSGSRLDLLDIEQKELTQFPFTITFERNKVNGRTASIRIRQQPQRIHDDFATSLGGHFCKAVGSLMTQARLKDVQITDDRERIFLAKELNSHHKEPYRHTVTVSERLTRSLKTYGDLPAITRGSDWISYTELDRRSDAVAYYLATHHGVKPGSTVGILAMHHIDWLVGACGIVKAGAAYLPIDANYPVERQAWLFKEGQNTGVLLAPSVPAHDLFHDVKIVLIDDIVNLQTPPVPLSKPSLQDVAAYIYTSGSTGVPKGVPLTQSGLDTSLQPDFGHLWAAPGRRTALMVSLGFDCAFLSTFGSLMYGGCVVLQHPDDPLEHLKDVHCLMCTPSMLASLNESEYKHLDSVALAGEALPQGIADVWSPGRRLINMYGPSECHVFATYKFLPPGEPVSLGRPLPTGRIYIVNPQTCTLVPVGLTGEIWIGGSSPTFGYVGLEEATAEKFINDPFGHSGERVYRTGDIGRWNLKGDVEYMGRTDDMIKVKGGFRLSLIGVESALNREASQFLGTHLNSATVVVVKDHLVAYVSPSTVDVVALRERLMDTEPHFAVPKWIIALDSVPTTPNQKVDKRALIARGLPQTTEHFVAPSTGTERTLASLWKDILDMSEDISATAHFVRLGGTSLNHIRLVSALQRHYRIKVPLTLTLWNPVLRHQAAMLDKLLVKEGKQLIEEVVLEDQDLSTLSHSEQGMWLVSQNSPVKTPFSVSVFYTIRGHVEIGHLKQAFDTAISHHSISRARYATDDTGKPRRLFHGDAPKAVVLTPSEFNSSLERNTNYVFDVASEHLIRVFLSSDEGKTDVLFTAHHMVVDHWTIDLLMKEVSSAYLALCNGKPIVLSTLALDYPQWAASTSQRPANVDSAKFWQEYLHGIPDCINLPLARARPTIETHGGKSHFFHLPQELRSAVESSAASLGITLHQFFSAALFLVLSVFSGQDDVVIGASHANRATADEYELCGLFLDRIPFRIAYKAETSTEVLLRSVAASQQEASLHFDMPFDEIVRAIQCRQDSGRHPIFQVMLSVENEIEALPKLRVPDAVVENNIIAPLGANFDILMAYQLLPNEAGMRLRFEVSEIYSDALVGAIEEAMRTALGLMAEGTRSTSQIQSIIKPLKFNVL